MAKRKIGNIDTRVAYELIVYDVMNDSVIGGWHKKVVWGNTLWGIAYMVMDMLKADGFKFEWDRVEGKVQPVPKQTNTVRYYRDLCVRKDGTKNYYSTGKHGNDYYIEAFINGRWVDIVRFQNVTERFI